MKRNNFILLSLFFLMILSVNKVDAAVSTCYYDVCSSPTNTNGLTIKYDTDTGKISTSMDKNDRYCVVDTSNINANTFIKDGKLVCPTLYNSYENYPAFTFYSKKVDNSSEIKYNKDKSNIPTVDVSTLKNCSVTYDNYELTITVDTKIKKIKGYSIPGYDVSGLLEYDDIIKDGKCSSSAKVFVTCDTVNGKKCTVRSDGGQNGANISGSSNPEDIQTNDNSLNGGLEQGEVVSGCEVIPEVIRKWINNILKFVRYVALALVIALGAIDFMKAAGTGEGDAMKKSGQSFAKRIIAVVILFLLPLLVDFILNMINIYGVDPNNIDCLK